MLGDAIISQLSYIFNTLIYQKAMDMHNTFLEINVVQKLLTTIKRPKEKLPKDYMFCKRSKLQSIKSLSKYPALGEMKL